MEELFEVLEGTQSIVTLKIEAFGFSMMQNVRVGSARRFGDGMEFYTDNESSFFISSVTSEIVAEDHDDMFDVYVIQTVSKAVITIVIDR